MTVAPARRTSWLAADGETLHLLEQGQGEPVVFMHGWTGTPERLTPLIEATASQYHTVAWFARGHGFHRYTQTTPCTVQQMADDLDQLLRQRWPEQQVRLVGHSMGACVLWAYLERHGSARVRQSVVVDMTPRLTTDADWPWGVYFDYPPSRQQAFVQALRDDFAEAVLRLSAYGRNPESRAPYERNDPLTQQIRTYLSRLDHPRLICAWESLLQVDFRELLRGLSLPTLLLYGGKSQYYGEELARWMAATLPHAELLYLPDGDHAPHLQHPEQCSAALLHFFAQAPSA